MFETSIVLPGTATMCLAYYVLIQTHCYRLSDLLYDGNYHVCGPSRICDTMLTIDLMEASCDNARLIMVGNDASF